MNTSKTTGFFRIVHLTFLSTIGMLSLLSAQEPPAAAPVTGGAVDAPAPAATFVVGRMIELRPDQKRPLALNANDRNPYAKRTIEEETTNESGENAEELQIRNRLHSLSITGQSQGPNGLRILLGDIILEQGRLLPQLLVDQSENLQVIEISSDTVVLGWLDIETNKPTGKTMQVSYDLTPQVSYALHGQEAGSETGAPGEVAVRQMGVLRIGQERKKNEAQMAAQSKSPAVPREVFEAGQ